MKHDVLPDNDLHAALQRVVVEVFKGIKHGHFEIIITGDANQNGHRNITVKSGLNHRYSTHKDRIPQTFPQVTFLQKAQTESAQPLVTSPQDAHADMDTNDEAETG